MTEETVVEETVEVEPAEHADRTAERLDRIEALLVRMVEALERKPALKSERGPTEPKRTLNNIID